MRGRPGARRPVRISWSFRRAGSKPAPMRENLDGVPAHLPGRMRPMSLEIPTRDELYVRYVDQLPYEPYPVQDARAGGLVRVRAGRPRLRADGHGQDADRRGGPLRGAAHGEGRLLHDAADRADRAEVPGDAGPRRRVGLPPRGRGAGHRQPQGQPRRPGARRRGRDPAEPAAQPVRLLRRDGLRHGRVPQLRRHRARHRLGAVARHAAQARPPAPALGDGRQRGRVRRLAGEAARPQDRAGRGQGTQGAADLRMGARRVPQRAARRDGGRRRGRPSDAGPGLLLQPRRVLERRRERHGQGPRPVRRAEEGAPRPGQRARLQPGGRPEAQADAPPRRRRPPRGAAAEVPPRRRGPLPAQAAPRRRLHRDAGGRHQPAGALGGALVAGEGPVRQARS